MTHLEYLREKLLNCHAVNSFTNALFVLTDNLLDADISGGNISFSDGDLGINVIGDVISIHLIGETETHTIAELHIKHYDIPEKTQAKIARITQFGRSIWLSMTDRERSCYWYDTGTIGFVEHIFDILHLSTADVTPEQFEQIHNSIIAPELDEPTRLI